MGALKLSYYENNISVNGSNYPLLKVVAKDGVIITPSLNYYTFHGAMPGRSFNRNAYRYGGSNGQEKDNEIFEGAYTAEFWEYDSRLGKRWNTDPVVDHSISPYACFANSPIFIMDVDGDDPQTPTRNTNNNNRAKLTRALARDIFKKANPLPKPNPYAMYGSNAKNVNIIKFKPSRVQPVSEPKPFELETNRTAESMRIIAEAVVDIKEYRDFVKTEKVTEAGFTDNTTSFMPAQYLTTTTTFIEIPAAIQKLEAGYQKKIRSQAMGKLTNDQFSKLPIQEQLDKYAGAKAMTMNGTSPLQLFKEKAIEKIQASQQEVPNTPGNLGGTTPKTLTAAPTY